MTVFGQDAFTDTAGDDLVTQHTPDVGTGWNLHSSSGSVSAAITDAGRCRLHLGTVGQLYYITDTSPSAEYDVTVDVYKADNTSSTIGPAGRINPSGNDCYLARHWTDNHNWELYKFLGGSYTLLGSYDQTLTDGNTYTCKLELRDAAKKVYIDGVERISSGDNDITAAGRAGFRGDYAQSNTTGLHVDNFVAETPTSSVDRAVAGNQPASTGTLTRLLQALRSLAGSQPASTGTLTRVLHASRALAGSQPNATGALTRVKNAVRSLAGSQPNATGTLARLLLAVRSLAGSQPSATGTLTRSAYVGARSLAGNQPSATGALSYVAGPARSVSGNQPAATGALSRLLQALRSFAGNQPNATGALTRLLQAQRALAGNQPSATGALSAARGFLRTVTGDQPASSGTLTRVLHAARAFAGNQPTATGVLSRVINAGRSLTGSQPTSTGTLSRKLTGLRSFAGSQPTATGVLTYVIVGGGSTIVPSVNPPGNHIGFNTVPSIGAAA